MRVKNLGLVRTCPAYPEQYNVMYIPTDNFFRELFNIDIKPIRVGYIHHKDGVTECYAVENDKIQVDQLLYKEVFDGPIGKAKIPVCEFSRVTKECFKRIARHYRFRRVKS